VPAYSVTAVIPVHNGAAILETLLASIDRQTEAFAEVIVVDDASSDGAPDVARGHGCRVIALATNAGFARAVNTGWQAAQTEFVAVLNSDVELDSAWLARLLEGIGDAGFATGMLVDASDHSRIDGTYDLISRAGCAWRAGHGELVSTHGTETRSIGIAPATACIFRRKVLERLGGFDESFGSYLEDVDLGLRCLRAGVTGVYVPKAVARHQGSATFGRWSIRATRLISKNQVLLVGRHFDAGLFRLYWWPVLVGQLLWGLVALRHGRGLSWAAGKIEGLRGFRLMGQPSAALCEFMETSERELRHRASGDLYWRWYFRLVARDVSVAAH
jgi:hypothetical protein